MDDSLINKLRSLGVQIGAGSIPARPPSAGGASVDQVIDGVELQTSFGPVFLTEENFPLDYVHGKLPMHNRHAKVDVLLQWAGYAQNNLVDPAQFLFLDTETSGLAGGTGTFAFMVGLGFWHEAGFKVIQLFMRDPSEENALLAKLIEITANFPAIVTFNGKAFDIPLLNTRYILNALSTPFSEVVHIDLLMLARRIWRNRLTDRSLGSLETEILSFKRGEEEIPGWMIPDLYFDYLKTSDARPLKGVFYHNRVDIVSLAALFKHLSALLDQPLSLASDESLDLIAIANLFEKLNRLEDAVRLYEYALNTGLPRHHFIQTIYRYASIHKKAFNWDQAVGLWQKAADFGEVDACIEIAKYHEHRTKRYADARFWSQKALDQLEKALLPRFLVKQIRQEIIHRLTRLESKINKEQHNAR